MMSVYRVYAWDPKRPEESIVSLELKLQVVISRHVGAGNGTWVLCKSSQCS